MASRIIKQGSSLSNRIQPLSFERNAAQEAKAEQLQVPSWMADPAPEGTAAPVRLPAVESAPAQAPPDLASVEKSAYESGFRQGEKAGMEIAEKKMEAVVRRYGDTILELGALRSKLFADVERQVVKLAIEVAKKIVHREIQADREIIQTLVKVALSHAAEKSAVTVHLSPADYNYLLEHRNELNEGDNSREVVLLADKSIERGGCLVQTECGDIDARIEEEFRELERGFFGATDTRR